MSQIAIPGEEDVPRIDGRPLVISASRRTDLPGFHAKACAERIRRRIAALRTRRLFGVVFWTRHVRPFLPGGPLNDLAAREIANPVINLTLTGLGSSRIEPGSPPLDAVLRDLPTLVEAFHGEPWRIRWRFDPLLKDWSSKEVFARIAARMSSLGIRTCTFSFPAYRSLKGDLGPAFERAGLPAWSAPEKSDFLGAMAIIAKQHGIALLSCAQEENLKLAAGVAEAQCIPRDVLEQGHPDRAPLALGRDRSQRSQCRCVESEDIGDYERDRCLGGCAYCYSKAGGPEQLLAR